MTSVLNVDTIADKAGTGPVALTKQSAAKSWIRMDGDPSLVISNSFNTSSTTDLNTGTYAQIFVNNFDANDNYSSHSTADDESFGNKTTIYYQTDSEVRMQVFQGSANAGTDTDRAMMTHHGDLA